MPLLFSEYQQRKLGNFKHKLTILSKNIFRLLALFFIYLIIFFYLNIANYDKNIIFSSFYFFLIIFFTLILVFVIAKKPILKEYIMFYIYMGESLLDDFTNSKDKPEKQLEKSKYFFKQLFNLLDRKVFNVYFENEIIRNKSMKDLDLIITEYIIPKLKMSMERKDADEIKKITYTSLSHIYDENFDKLHKFLEPYVKEFYPKKITKERIISKLKSSPLLFYGLLVIISSIGIISVTFIIFWLDYGWDVVIGVFTILMFAFLLLNAIRTTTEKFKSK